jgi:hypothetical protein
MELTQDKARVLCGAWAAHQSGGGVALDDPGDFVAAHELAEVGWLERRFVGDDLAWFWTQAAETALDLHSLTADFSPN